MKQTIVKLFLLVSLLWSASGAYAQPVSGIIIDMSAAPMAPTITKSADFSVGFDVNLVNNAVGATRIMVTSNQQIPVLLKPGITAADVSLIQLPFRFNASSNTLTLNFNGQSIAVGAPIQITYGSRSVVINNVSGNGGGNGNAGNNGNTGNNTDNGTPVAATTDIISKPTGIPLHDAVLVFRYFKAGDDSLFTVLGQLKNAPPADWTKTALLQDKYYGQNPFIRDLLNAYNSNTVRAMIQGGGGGIAGVLSKIGNIDVTTIADGIARFLVKRTKEELNVAFFERFKELINKPEYLDARILFPKTLQVLNTINTDIYQFDNYINSLREAFDNDLSLLLDNMPSVIEEGRFKDYFNDHANIKYAALLSLFAGKELLNGTHPGKVIADLPGDYVDAFADKNVTGAIKTVQLFSNSLRSRGGERYWSTPDTLKMLVNKAKDFATARFYLGFLYEAAGGIDFASDSLRKYLSAVATQVNEVEQYAVFARQLGQQCQDVEAAIRQIRTKSPGEPAIDVYNRLFGAVADVLDKINTVGTLPRITINGRITADAARYIKSFRLANDLALNVSRRNYALAISDAYNIYLTITAKETNPEKEKLTDNTALYASKASFDNTATSKKEVTESNSAADKVAAFIKKYGAFISNVVKAKTSQEVADAIEAVALPVGSASIKKKVNWNVAIQAYTGLSIAHHSDGLSSFPRINGMSVYAPLGISVSRRIGCSALSLFASVFDVGAIVSYRFKDNKSNLADSVKIRLENIFSPGLNLVWGVPKFPVSIGGGFQWQPSLTRLNTSSATIAERSGMRYHLFVAVDIPLFNLFNSKQ